MNSFFIVCCLKLFHCYSNTWKKFKFCCNKALFGVPAKVFKNLTKIFKFVGKHIGFYVKDEEENRDGREDDDEEEDEQEEELIVRKLAPDKWTDIVQEIVDAIIDGEEEYANKEKLKDFKLNLNLANVIAMVSKVFLILIIIKIIIYYYFIKF